MAAFEISNPAALPADWRDFLALTRRRVMSLVVFSGLCGLLVAPVQLPLVLSFTAILCIALAAGACGALNQWYEADIDAKMRRTAKRPLPAGRMERQSALHFGVWLGTFSVLLMGLATNWLAAAPLDPAVQLAHGGGRRRAVALRPKRPDLRRLRRGSERRFRSTRRARRHQPRQRALGHGRREAFVRLFGLLPVRPFYRPCRGSL